MLERGCFIPGSEVSEQGGLLPGGAVEAPWGCDVVTKLAGVEEVPSRIAAKSVGVGYHVGGDGKQAAGDTGDMVEQVDEGGQLVYLVAGIDGR